MNDAYNPKTAVTKIAWIFLVLLFLTSIVYLIDDSIGFGFISERFLVWGLVIVVFLIGMTVVAKTMTDI